MDTPKTITHIGLCAGYGGIELGLHRVIRNLRSVALCEIEAFAVANLVAKMEAGLLDCAPIWTDLKTFPWAEFRDRVDILTGGYPCQPFSAAGKRLGTEDPRHLWPFIADGIRILRPKLCYFENVEGHISLGLREVIGELESIGYQTAWGIFSASEVGAPHQRKRVFILAVSNSLGGAAGLSRSLAWDEGVAGESNHGSGKGGGELADPNGRRFQQCESKPKQADNAGLTSKQAWPSRPGELANSSSQRDRESQQGISLANQCLSWREEGSADAGRCLQAWPSRPGEPQHAWEPPRVVAALADSECNGLGGQSETRLHGRRPTSKRDESSEGEADRAFGDDPDRRGLGNAAGDGSHQCCEEARGEERSGEEGRLQEPSGGSASMADARNSRPSRAGRKPQSGGTVIVTGDHVAEAMGNADPRRLASGIDAGSGAEADRGGQGDFEQAESGQAQPALGGDLDGPAGGLGYAELCVSCDNRTDELRLLGNGVVPATATRAFLTLWEELFQQQPTN